MFNHVAAIVGKYLLSGEADFQLFNHFAYTVCRIKSDKWKKKKCWNCRLYVG